jgi:hypothetical protein
MTTGERISDWAASFAEQTAGLRQHYSDVHKLQEDVLKRGFEQVVNWAAVEDENGGAVIFSQQALAGFLEMFPSFFAPIWKAVMDFNTERSAGASLGKSVSSPNGASATSESGTSEPILENANTTTVVGSA